MRKLTPLDGRYAKKLNDLLTVMGEDALTRNRVKAEAEYFLALAAANIFELKAAEALAVKKMVELSDDDLQTINDIEFNGYKEIKPTNHDVKAIEYFLREKFAAAGLEGKTQWLHFALTSEDINSLAYAFMLRDSLEQVFVPLISQLQQYLLKLSKKYAQSVMLARTHGQPAVPTTFGKECRVFEQRLLRQFEQLKKTKISCKFSGAVGNYNAHYAAFEGVDWLKFTQNFINNFNRNRDIKIILTEVSTQIDPHDTYAELFDNLRRINMILIDLAQDSWRYISDDILTQKAVEGEVGSSTMPQKVNPIDFENAEGNFGLANALYTYFSGKLTVSRLQRDLSDSTVLRNIAAAFGYNAVALRALQKGLSKVEFNEKASAAQLALHPEVLAEAVQTILRVSGVKNPYEKLKDLTRGKKITQEALATFIEGLDVPVEVKAKLKKLNGQNYIGTAAKLARKV